MEYGYFLSKVWDEWLARDVGKVLVNFCETLVAQHMGLPSQVCVHGEVCGKGVAVEHDDKSLGDMVFSREQVKFGYAKSETLPDYCRKCEFLSDCWGECPKNRFLRTPDGQPGLNYLCPGLKRFFAHAVPTAQKLAARFQAAERAG
jgi:uncharacterized protein